MITAQQAAQLLDVQPEFLLALARHGQIAFTKDPDDPHTIMFDPTVIEALRT